jgi:NAD(P)H-dependent FMN reductase
MKIQIIIGSTRPGRVGPQIAQWVLATMPKEEQISYEIVDIADYHLPLFDEPKHPSTGEYSKEHTKVWSKKINEADAYIFVTPEYNAGYPASLKNAIDFLYHEWTAKPALIVSYGIRGGQGASAQLKQVLERLKMKPTELSPAFSVSADMHDEAGQIKNISESFESYEAEIKNANEQLLKIANSKE